MHCSSGRREGAEPAEICTGPSAPPQMCPALPDVPSGSGCFSHPCTEGSRLTSSSWPGTSPQKPFLVQIIPISSYSFFLQLSSHPKTSLLPLGVPKCEQKWQRVTNPTKCQNATSSCLWDFSHLISRGQGVKKTQISKAGPDDLGELWGLDGFGTRIREQRLWLGADTWGGFVSKSFQIKHQWQEMDPLPREGCSTLLK